MKKEEKLTKTDKAILFGLLAGITGFWILIGLCVVPNVLVSQFFKGPGKEYRHLLYNEARGSRMAEEALEEKYGEEFIVHDVWSKSPHDFYATCSPKANEEVVFEAVLWKDDGEIEYDEYVQGIVARQISDKLESELQGYFADCYVWTYVFYEPDISFANASNISLKDYAQKAERSCLVCIYVDEEKLDSKSIEKEYEYFSIHLQNEIINKAIIPTSIGIYAMDKDELEWCRDYFKTRAQTTGKEYVWRKVYFGYPELYLNKTYDEYKTQREEMMENE